MKIYNYFKKIAEGIISQESRLKNIGEAKHFLLEEKNKNKMMIKKLKKASAFLNYIEHFLILAFTIAWGISISHFSPLIGIPIGIKSSAVGLEICTITTGIKNCKLIFKEKKKEHVKTVLLVKSKSNSKWISKAFINTIISHDKFVILNNVQKKYEEMKEQIKKSNNK